LRVEVHILPTVEGGACGDELEGRIVFAARIS
jgi:hypothetical protein